MFFLLCFFPKQRSSKNNPLLNVMVGVYIEAERWMLAQQAYARKAGLHDIECCVASNGSKLLSKSWVLEVY